MWQECATVVAHTSQKAPMKKLSDWIKYGKWTPAKPGFADLIIFLNNGYIFSKAKQWSQIEWDPPVCPCL